VVQVLAKTLQDWFSDFIGAVIAVLFAPITELF
jgi:hypothetical protein